MLTEHFNQTQSFCLSFVESECFNWSNSIWYLPYVSVTFHSIVLHEYSAQKSLWASEQLRTSLGDNLPINMRGPSYSSCLFGLANRLSQGCFDSIPLKNYTEKNRIFTKRSYHPKTTKRQIIITPLFSFFEMFLWVILNGYDGKWCYLFRLWLTTAIW